MPLTLGFLASVILLLPGLVALAAFNFRVGRAGARRPEQQLTTINALVAAVILSIMTHYLGYLVAAGATDAAIAIHDAFPKLDLGPAVRNPVAAYYAAVTSGAAMPGPTAIATAALLALEVFVVLAFVGSETFDLLFEPLDWTGQGWVFQHITRPAENGYAPIGHVFTSTMSGVYGVAYKGIVIDARQGANGELVSIALARPERFLYELGAFPIQTSRWFWRGKEEAGELDRPTGFTLHGKETVGGVVQLDARVITNVVVHSVSQSLLEELAPGEAAL
ncbi:hypothetical protein [Sphingomonas sp. PP-CC-3G-468]|uniref:hypothetical protein n=1 Tax=Sphingomonas sp. PP-CC-3G-468 TaxID=2135656 RepID=UPI00104DBBE8|nr:hypothetical protein [Sphingomonas sp. PP-CC-3G-468]TCM00241.1 hypothetical protein C8J41_1242 [Sphingomonas sp. PP-CC-3G-468]